MGVLGVGVKTWGNVGNGLLRELDRAGSQNALRDIG
jgi:hypothetical protein